VAPGAAPQRPLASGAYVLGLPDGRLLMGATQQANDPDPGVRASDHAANLASARRLLGCEVALPQSLMQGRVGWRVVTRDRLPLAGRVPDLAAPLPARRDAPRLVARRPGLVLLCALGSRGLTTAALCAELIAAQATGAPWPLEADLADAIDPARLALR
jgi:tRNA 5-methylaminomethyl-2-thiouridine biosynthesis bifunctional protein